MAEKKILIVGANGQVGQELSSKLIKYNGIENVICADIKENNICYCRFRKLDILDNDALISVIKEYQITEIYLLAALLSAKAEKNIQTAWELNMQGLINVLELGRTKLIKKIFWPSSIAVFGPNSPKIFTPQITVTEPTTIYGITKVAGENLCNYYFQNFDVDVRSVRYPGLIGYVSLPGGGTTDYAVQIFYDALKNGSYCCFLSKDTILPMMYMSDAIRATIEIMNASTEQIKIRTSYNIAGISFSPDELAMAIKKHIPTFRIDYKPDFRQQIADNWPESIDDSFAQKDWQWHAEFNLENFVTDMLYHLNQAN